VLSPSVVLLAGCQLPDPAPGNDEWDAHIAVDRPEITFPAVDVGDDEPVVQWLTVKNVGTDRLDVAWPRIERGTDFRVAAPFGVKLDPGGTFTYDIAFDPRSAFEHEDVFALDSNDPEQPSLAIPLHGMGIAPVLAIDLRTLDLATSVGCDVAGNISIGNDGNDLLIVQVPSFESSSSELALDASGYPLEIGPGDVATIEVVYRPLDETPDSAVVHLSSNDPFGSDAVVEVEAHPDDAAPCD
jgi:hypothetical protein